MAEKKKKSIIGYTLSAIILALAVGLVVWALISTNKNMDYKKALDTTVTQSEKLLQNYRVENLQQPAPEDGKVTAFYPIEGVGTIFTMCLDTQSLMQYMANTVDFQYNTLYRKVNMSSGHTGTLAITAADSKISGVMELKDSTNINYYTFQITYDFGKGLPVKMVSSVWGNVFGNANQTEKCTLEINFTANKLHSYMVIYNDTVANVSEKYGDETYLKSKVTSFALLDGTIKSDVLSVSAGIAATACTETLFNNDADFKAASGKLFPILKNDAMLTIDKLQLTNQTATISELPEQFFIGKENGVWKLKAEESASYQVLQKGTINVEGK